jgi:hypothetical protein
LFAHHSSPDSLFFVLAEQVSSDSDDIQKGEDYGIHSWLLGAG